MAMDFFEHQEAARTHTTRLIVLFVLAVLGIIAMSYVVVALFVAFTQGRAVTEHGTFDPAVLWDWQLMVVVSAAVLIVVGGAMLARMAQLRAGGHAVAEMMGGRRLDPSGSLEPKERRLLNIVEEIAIASGTPVPPVYLMDGESGINAFAAGHAPDDAAIGVTRGTLQTLDRDELQGVIAHEFSHVRNGDMRLNIRLMGVVYGILVIGFIGWFVLRSSFYASAAGSRRSDRGGGGAWVVAVLALGVSLVLIGFIGSFFGNLIKAGVSRQREYLADASAVQFTRNPAGIAGALKKIGGYSEGSEMQQVRAMEIDHMLFSKGFRQGLASLYATHPPLDDRIRRLDPSFEGAYAPVQAEPSAELQPGTASAAGFASAAGPSPGDPYRRGGAEAPESSGGATRAAGLQQVLAQIGQPDFAHLDYAHRLVESIPAAVRDAVHEPFGARAVTYALLLDPEDGSVREHQLRILERYADAPVFAETQRLRAAVGGLDPGARLPLVDMALPSLGEMSNRQYTVFRDNLSALIHADEKVDPFEWALSRVTLHHLERRFGHTRPATTHYYSLKRLTAPCSVLLSRLAYAGQEPPDSVQEAFTSGAALLDVEGVRLLPREQCRLAALDEAVETLAMVAPKLKRRLLQACATCIAADREVTSKEGELFRAIGAALDCPVPPLLPGQRVA